DNGARGVQQHFWRNCFGVAIQWETRRLESAVRRGDGLSRCNWRGRGYPFRRGDSYRVAPPIGTELWLAALLKPFQIERQAGKAGVGIPVAGINRDNTSDDRVGLNRRA